MIVGIVVAVYGVDCTDRSREVLPGYLLGFVLGKLGCHLDLAQGNATKRSRQGERSRRGYRSAFPLANGDIFMKKSILAFLR